MISNHKLKSKFINGLRPDLRLAVRRQIHYDMSFDDIVAKATVIADIYYRRAAIYRIGYKSMGGKRRTCTSKKI